MDASPLLADSCSGFWAPMQLLAIVVSRRGPSVCVSVILVHSAKAVGRNKMLFDRDTHVVASNIVLDSGLGLPTGMGNIWVGTPDLYA